MTALPLDSSSEAAELSPLFAAAHVVVVAFSASVSAALDAAPPPPTEIPPADPPDEDVVVDVLDGLNVPPDLVPDGTEPVGFVPVVPDFPNEDGGVLPIRAAPPEPLGPPDPPPIVPIEDVCAADGPTLGMLPVCGSAAVATPKDAAPISSAWDSNG